MHHSYASAHGARHTALSTLLYVGELRSAQNASVSVEEVDSEVPPTKNRRGPIRSGRRPDGLGRFVRKL